MDKMEHFRRLVVSVLDRDSKHAQDAMMILRSYKLPSELENGRGAAVGVANAISEESEPDAKEYAMAAYAVVAGLLADEPAISNRPCTNFPTRQPASRAGEALLRCATEELLEAFLTAEWKEKGEKQDENSFGKLESVEGEVEHESEEMMDLEVRSDGAYSPELDFQALARAVS
jgi:hypothetical protein